METHAFSIMAALVHCNPDSSYRPAPADMDYRSCPVKYKTRNYCHKTISTFSEKEIKNETVNG